MTKEQTQYEQILRQGIKSFYENGGDCASMEQLASIMYIRNDYVMYVILKYAIHKIYDKELSIRKWVKDITNIGYLTERLDDDSSVYIVIVSDNNGEICDVLANVLALLEKKVFVIRQPEIVETSKKLTEGEILRISIENKEEYDEFTVYPAVKAMGEGLTERIFYATAKTVTRTVAEEAITILRDGGMNLKTVTLTAKEKICFMEETESNPED